MYVVPVKCLQPGTPDADRVCSRVIGKSGLRTHTHSALEVCLPVFVFSIFDLFEITTGPNINQIWCKSSLSHRIQISENEAPDLLPKEDN